MEQETATRRISHILGHLANAEELPSLHHLFPMNCSSTLNSMGGRCDNRLLFARQGSAAQAYHMKQQSMRQNPEAGCGIQEKKDQNSHSCSSQKNFREPMFSKQAQTIPQFQNTRTDPPRFSRRSEKQMAPLPNEQMEWAPRMDAVDMGRFYALTIELAGVKISDIQVEVDDRKCAIFPSLVILNNLYISLKPFHMTIDT
ncbi:Small heat shock protein C2 [Rhynchospora pubera]|uniref:Small heat shock protein C2 n=1 Tax=Rhynchospora pubera TaxID=906938 RepID=A0AAV8GZ66_9POAL|nr:Small heat shock protein C2 [Rhynchospora pubera]